MTRRLMMAMVLCGVGLLAQTSPPSAETRKAAEQGDATAQSQMGRAYLVGLGVPKDAAEALKWFRKAAEQGNPNAQFNLGLMCTTGQGVTKDYAEAARWYGKAAGQGHPNAQYALGLMYTEGRGMAQNYQEAARLFRKAAEQGDPDAQSYLGFMYTMGQGLAQDYQEAARWFRKAAEQGEPNAQLNLGFMYTKGQGAPQDYAEAVRWYRKAAEQGKPDAQFRLGGLYSSGQGVAQDYVAAHMWLNLAASKSSGEDQKLRAGARDTLAKRMTPQQIAEAERRAGEWQPVVAQGSAPAVPAPTATGRGVPEPPFPFATEWDMSPEPEKARLFATATVDIPRGVYKLALQCANGALRIATIEAFTKAGEPRPIAWPTTAERGAHFRRRDDGSAFNDDTLTPTGLSHVGQLRLRNLPQTGLVVADVFPNEGMEFSFQIMSTPWALAPVAKTKREVFQELCFSGVQSKAAPAPDVSATAVRITGNMRPPTKTKDAQPVYPRIAKMIRAKGVVVIEITIDPSGKVREPTVLQSLPMFDGEAVDAVAQWEYAPTLRNGVAVPVIMTVTVSFAP